MLNFNSCKFFIFCVLPFILNISLSYSNDNSKWLSINKKGMQAFKERDFKSAENYYLHAINEARNSNLGPELSATMNNLGLLKIELGMSEEAEGLINESLKLRLQYYGINHRYVAQSYNNLARVYESTFRIEESIDLYVKTIKIYETLGARYKILLARTLINLSTVQLLIEDLDVAQLNLIRALSIAKEFSEDNAVSLSAMHNLATLFTQRGNFDEAEKIYLRLIDIRRNNKGDNSISYARVLNNLAVLYKKQCKYELAYPYLLEALNIWENSKSTDYSNFAKAYHNQGELLKAKGKYSLAIASFKRGINLLNNSIDGFYEQYIEQSFALINLYAKLNMDIEVSNLLKIINKVRLNKGEIKITLNTMPDGIYEKCSSSNI
jgi:tetratricopeptide (TPR) repeat protein